MKIFNMKKIFFKGLFVNKALYLSLFILLAIYGFSSVAFSESEKRLKSEHFNFIAPDNIDSAQLASLSYVLEANYNRITTDLKTKPADSIKVFVYDNRLNFYEATGLTTASGTIIGPDQLHFMMKNWQNVDAGVVAVHEFAHAVNLKLLIDIEPNNIGREKFDAKFSTFPLWLWEGLACYEAGQFYHPKSIPLFAENKYPSLQQLSDRKKGQIIYKVGYVLIEYLLAEFGREKFLQLIKNYGDVEKTLGVNEEQIERGWHHYVTEKYLK